MTRIKKANHETRDTLAELERTYVKKDVEEKILAKPDKFNAATYSTGMSAASLTSTAFERVTSIQAARLDDEVVLFNRIKKKGYVRIQTNLGPLNIELYCDTVPKTSQNFITHCANGYYNNTIFHRYGLIILQSIFSTLNHISDQSDTSWSRAGTLRAQGRGAAVSGEKPSRQG